MRNYRQQRRQQQQRHNQIPESFQSPDQGHSTTIQLSPKRLRVVARFRPPLKHEKKLTKNQQFQDGSFLMQGVPSTMTQSPLSLRTMAHGRQKNVKYQNFDISYGINDKNCDVYDSCVKPLICDTTGNTGTLCFLCYGHTGHGKSHTVLGYGPEYGMYHFAIQDLCAQIQHYPDMRLSLRFAEMHNGKIFDLMNNRVQCDVRADSSGQLRIRSATISNKKDRKVRVNPLHGKVVRNLQEAEKALELGIKERAVGRSSLHSQSSRSHALLEIEVVNRELVALREEILQAETNLVPLGHERDSWKIENMSKCYVQTPDGQWVYSPDPVLEQEGARLDALVAAQESKIQQLKQQEQEMVRKDQSGMLTRLAVFVDLAGADHESSFLDWTAQERKENKDINSSLLSLKECIRALHSKKKHIPFRNSKLTLLLKRYMLGHNAKLVMMANVASCGYEKVSKLSINTLNYASLVAQK